MRRSPRITLEELSCYCMRLGQLIRTHHREEAELVFTPLLREGGIDRVPHLRAVLVQNQTEKGRYSANVSHWTPQRIAADWDGYVAEVAGRTQALTDFLRSEEETIYRPVMRMVAAERPRATGTGHGRAAFGPPAR